MALRLSARPAHALGALLLLAGITASAASCSSSKPDALAQTGAASVAAGSTAEIVATSARIGQKDKRISAALAERDAAHGFHVAGDDFAAPALDAHVGRRARDALQVTVGAGGAAGGALVLHPEGARDVAGVPSSGRVVFADAFEAADRIVTSRGATTIEELLLLRSAAAPATFSWSVDLPAAIARVGSDGRGGLDFRDAAGRRALHMVGPYAVDDSGARRAAEAKWDATTRRLSVHLDTRGLRFPVLLDPAFETAQWTAVGPPSVRSNVGIAYDPVHQQTVLFGGDTDEPYQPTAQTWLFDGRRWSQASPATSPPARDVSRMAYDAARQRVIFFGGYTSLGDGGDLGDTWTWDGISWAEQTPVDSPPARSGALLAYDSVHQRVVLYGGELDPDTATGAHDTWLWDGFNWTNVTAAVYPPGLRDAAMEFDAAQGKTVLFGGVDNDTNARSNATWLFDGATWTMATPGSSPPARSEASSFYDSVRGQMVIYGGLADTTDGSVDTLTDTWSWTGATWTQIATTGTPTGDSGENGAYDSTRQRGLIFQTNEFSDADPFESTWELDGTTWSAPTTLDLPAARVCGVMTADTTNGNVLLFGGEAGNGVEVSDTWTWNGAEWTEMQPATSPPARSFVQGAFDPLTGTVVTFGGYVISTDHYLSDTWSWNGATSTWTKAQPAKSPSARDAYGLAYDPDLGKVVFFGGYDGTADHNDTWTWDGTSWAQLTTAHAPGARDSFGFAYDATHHAIVLYSGNGGGAFDDTWTFDGTDWTQAPVVGTPPHDRQFEAMAYDPIAGQVILFGGYQNGSSYNDTWSWNGAIWTQLSATSSPDARWGMGIAPDPLHDGLVAFSGAGASPYSDTWIFSSSGGGCTSGAQCDSGFCVDGVCCGTPSCSACQTCAGTTPGVCTWVSNAPDPDSCTGTSSCDASGTCLAAIGQMCTGSATCASGFCVDGVCCDGACEGKCQACSAAQKGGGSDGACGLAGNGHDPHADCTSSNDCSFDGECDGAGNCRHTPAGVSCGTSECEDNRATGRVCNGLGSCTLSATGVSCAPYVCSNASGGCLEPCTTDSDCTLGNYCDGAACKSRESYGAACTSANQCPVGASCADGVCCNTACGGQCEACDESGTEGTCVPVIGAPRGSRQACAGTTGSDVCTAASCNGVVASACDGLVGASVTCRAASCTDGVATVSASCTGKGTCAEAVTVNCTPYVCRGSACATSCSSDSDCNAKFHCDATKGTCVVRTEATCDGDHTLTAPDGLTSSCAPYECNGSTCETACGSIRDCSEGFICDGDHHCVAPDGGSLADGGCALAGGSRDASGGAIWTLFGIACALRRRRAAREGGAQ